MTELYAVRASAAFVTRRFTSRAPELRDVNGSKHIAGYASVFNKLSRNLGGFVEQIDRRAFDQALIAGFPDVMCRYNHDDNYLLGTTRGGTLDLRTDETGLWYDVIPPSFRADIIELCARGDVTQSSFAFRVPDDGDYWERSGPAGMPMRTVINTELVDVAPVNNPAYPDATASARNFDEDLFSSLARFTGSEMTEVRNYLGAHDNNVAKFFKLSNSGKTVSNNEARDQEGTPPVEPEVNNQDEEDRAKLTSKARNDLPDSAFAYIAPDGTKHFPIHDAAHVRNALARIAQGAKYGKEALPKVKAAAKKFGIKSEEQNDWAVVIAELRGIDLPAWYVTIDAEVEDRDEESEDEEVREDDEDRAGKMPADVKEKMQAKSKKKSKGSDSDDDSDDDSSQTNQDEDDEDSDDESRDDTAKVSLADKYAMLYANNPFTELGDED